MSGITKAVLKPRQLVIETVRSHDDTLDLRYGVWRGSTKPQRFVILVNGRTEWLEKYAYLADDLGLPDDCGFLSWDHRGQGGSGGLRGHVATYEDFAADAAVIVQAACGERPYALVTHSMGGLIGLYSVLHSYLKPQALVLAAPLLGLPTAGALPLPLITLVSQALTAMRLGTLSTGAEGSLEGEAFAGNRYTHHAARYAAMQATPYPVGAPTFAWVKASLQAMAACFDPQRLSDLNVATLVLGGTQERIVEFAAFQRWVQVAAVHAKAEVQLQLVQGARHELFSEIEPYYSAATAAVRHWFKQILE